MRPASNSAKVDLPEPFFSEKQGKLAFRDLQVYPLQNPRPLFSIFEANLLNLDHMFPILPLHLAISRAAAKAFTRSPGRKGSTPRIRAFSMGILPTRESHTDPRR